MHAAGTVLIALAAYAAFSGLYRRARSKQAAVFTQHYAGVLSRSGDAVRFQYRGATFELRRVASGGGISGAGSFPQLVLFLAGGQRLDLAPSKAAKYLYALSVPAEHSVVTTPAVELLVVGPDHEAAAAALAQFKSTDLFERVFSRKYSTLRVVSDIWVGWRRPFHRVWTLQLSGAPSGTYEQPEVLRPVLDGVLSIASALGLSVALSV